MSSKKEMGRSVMPKKKAKTRLDLSNTGRLRAKQMTKRAANKSAINTKRAAKKAASKASSFLGKVRKRLSK